MKYMMSKVELGKLTIIQGTVDGVYAVKEAALHLLLGKRRIKQLKKEFRLHGEVAVIHENAGNTPPKYYRSKNDTCYIFIAAITLCHFLQLSVIHGQSRLTPQAGQP
jgi:predicted Ser/Thr protein kinase